MFLGCCTESSLSYLHGCKVTPHITCSSDWEWFSLIHTHSTPPSLPLVLNLIPAVTLFSLWWIFYIVFNILKLITWKIQGFIFSLISKQKLGCMNRVMMWIMLWNVIYVGWGITHNKRINVNSTLCILTEWVHP